MFLLTGHESTAKHTVLTAETQIKTKSFTKYCDAKCHKAAPFEAIQICSGDCGSVTYFVRKCVVVE
jgi:hypothetical protein